MCMCASPNINGEPGYSWDGKNIGTRPVNPPTLAERDVLLYDEPGRCGGMDSHCHHYRLVKNCGASLLVAHGGGEGRMRVSLPRGFNLDGLDSNTRYWIFNAIFHASSDARRDGRDKASHEYSKAFVDGRLKKRKKQGSVKVWIEPVVTKAEAA